MQEDFFGEVIWFNAERGFGFISWNKDGAEQDDMFFHYSGINQDGYKQLKAQDKVSFHLGKNNSGQVIAVNINVLE